MNYEKQLKDLRNKLEREHMSLLVGAGFSKNVHKAFLSWDELLFDLTKELFGEEINTAFHQQNRSAIKNKLQLAAFTKQKCKEITARFGYLEVVAEYIRRKGFPESIATYIEDRTPAIAKDGKDFILTIGNKQIEIKADKLGLHRKVIELPWNNIYTTNYDELLDCCVDETQVIQIRKEIGELENENSILYGERTKLSIKKFEIPDEIEKPGVSLPGSPVDLAVVGLGEQPDENSKTLEQLQKEIDLNEARIKDNEETIKEKEITLLSRYHVVRSAADLRLKRTKNIIKLHGSLRSSDQKAQFFFQFDGDPHKQYVIAKADYDEYPKKHEAFTQLMRIALLQESFCLIGFSGVDPNFKAWINWVKDILHKEAIKNKQHHYKIYLIDVGASDIPSDQQLFYENHSIVRIPLQQPEVISFLQKETENRIKISDPWTALKALFVFLENGDAINPEISQLDLSVENQRNKIWNEFKVYDIQNKPNKDKIQKTLNQLEAISGKLWIPNINYANSHNQHSLISYVNYQAYREYLLKDDSDDSLKKLVILALKDQYLPINNFLEEEILYTFLSNPEISYDAKRLLARVRAFDTLETPEQSFYDEILRLAYSFNFKAVHEKLLDWQPQGKEHIQRSGFLAIFDHKKTADNLARIADDDYILTDEELLYAHELLHFLRSISVYPVDKKIKRAIRQFEKAGFQTLENKFEYLTSNLENKIKSPTILGENRFSITRSITFRQHSDPETALQYLMLLAESGFQLMINRTYREAAASWYNIFQSGFEHYPYPFLFYSLQYGDESTLKRIGQSYAFNEGNKFKVRNELPVIVNRLLDNFLNAPVDYQHHMLVFLSKAIIAVDPSIWQKGFLNIWKELLSRGVAFGDPRRLTYLHFFISAIQYTSDSKILTEIVKDALIYIKTENPDQAISYLYYLNRNKYYRNIKHRNIPTALSSLFDATINDLSQNRDDLIFVIGNIHILLSKRQKARVSEMLRSFDFNSVKNPRSWHIFLYFINDDASLKLTLKNAIIQNEGIWHTGVKNNTHSFGGMKLIELSRLTKSKYLKNGLVWNQYELEFLFKKLKVQIPGIQYFMELRDETNFNFVDVLDDMYWFLNQFKKELSRITDFEETLARVSNLYFKDRNYSKLDEGLISDDHSTVVWSLGELSKLVFQKVAPDAQIKTVMYKVLLQNDPALEASISYISVWAKDILTDLQLTGFAQIYIEILKRYKDKPLIDADVAYVEEKLLIIAYSLSDRYYQDEAISWWKNRGNESVYNNIKQYLIDRANTNED